MQRFLRHPRVLAVLAGFSYVLAAAPIGWVPFVFVAGYLWIEAVREATPRADAKVGAKLGLLVGFACHVVCFYWALPLFTHHVPIPLPIALLLAMLVWFGQALPFAVTGALMEVFHASRLPRSLALALALPIAFELTWSAFPWRPAEIAVGFEVYAQIADLTGPSLLDLAIVLAGAATLEGLRTRRRGLVAIGALAAVLPFVYGVPRIDEVAAMRERAPILRVGAVQPNVMQTVKFVASLAPAHADNLRHLTEEVEQLGVDVSVWPETSYPWPLRRDLRRDPIGRHGVHHRGLVQGPVIFGTLSYGEGCDNRNSVFAMQADGTVVGAADKVALLPFSEWIPFWEQLTFLHPYVPCGGFVAGRGPQLLDFVGTKIGVLNCYEDLLPWYARSVANESAGFLLNVTNDAWFLDTSEPHLHHMAARLRTIETRRDLLRVVNTGLTGLVDATGRRREELPVWTRGVMVAEVRLLPDASSPYLAHGDRLLPLLLAAAGLATLVAAVRLSAAGRAA